LAPYRLAQDWHAARGQALIRNQTDRDMFGVAGKIPSQLGVNGNQNIASAVLSVLAGVKCAVAVRRFSGLLKASSVL
jgi:hypothetical protein